MSDEDTEDAVEEVARTGRIGSTALERSKAMAALSRHRHANTPPVVRAKGARKAARALWKSMSFAERKAEMQRRRIVGLRRKAERMKAASEESRSRAAVMELYKQK